MVVEWDPPLVFANQPVQLRVRLTNTRMADRVACLDFVCEWVFPKPVGRETGWRMTHYFRSPSEALFQVQFRRLDGTHVCDPATGHPVTLQSSQAGFSLGEPAKPGLSDTAKAETWKLAFTLFLAIAGLIVGAREQFMKLDVYFGLLTVLLLGFSADTVKNLFSKRS